MEFARKNSPGEVHIVAATSIVMQDLGDKGISFTQKESKFEGPFKPTL